MKIRKFSPKEGAKGALRYFGRAILESRTGSRFPRFSHYARRFTPVVLVASIAWSYVPGKGVWMQVATVAVAYAGFYAIMSGLAHTSRLCQYCIDEFPLDGAEQASARRRRLWVYHFHWKRWLFGPIVCELLISYVGPHFGLRGYRNVLAWTPFALAFAWGVYRYTLTHDRLQLWCPWCRHNRPQDVVEPEPDPSENRPVPA